MDARDIGEIAVVCINIGIPVAIILTAMVCGILLERRHFASIRAREQATAGLPAIPSKAWDAEREVARALMVSGSVVVSIDYFKRILGGLRNIVGGRVRSYESVLDRGRREAILRMKEQCPGADIIVNFRMETSTISKTTQNGKQAVGCIEVLAYGTAITYRKPGRA